MAKAGFVHCPSENEPDVACCFYCLRELEGWEPEDNPWWAPAAHLYNLSALFFLAIIVQLVSVVSKPEIVTTDFWWKRGTLNQH